MNLSSFLTVTIAGLWAAGAVVPPPGRDAFAAESLRVAKPVSSAGLRHYQPGIWGMVDVEIINSGDAAGEATISSFFSSDPTQQFGRRLWVPPRAIRKSWHPVLPPGDEVPEGERYELKSLLILSDQEASRDEKQVRLRNATLLPAKPRRFVTGLIEDPSQETTVSDPYALLQAMRDEYSLAPEISTFPGRFLPPTVTSLEGLDQLLVCSDRAAGDVAGLNAIRHWVFAGGRLWIMLDRVSQETVGLLVQDACDVQMVDRVEMTDVQLRTEATGATRQTSFEEPVRFTRVLTSADEVKHTVDGWPAAFVQPIGRGQIIFTAVDARAWLRPRALDEYGDQNGDDSSGNRLSARVASDELLALANEYLTEPKQLPMPLRELRPMLTEQVGYRIVSRRTLLGLLGLFCLVLLSAAAFLAKQKRLELIGWIAPIVALATAAIIVVLGAKARNTVPDTMAQLQIVETSPVTDSVRVQGLAALYHRQQSEQQMGMHHEGIILPDSSGLTGQVRRMVWTDMHRWHFENLALPSGVRFAEYKLSARRVAPTVVRGRFGPEGFAGQLSSSVIADADDAIIATEARQSAAVRLDDQMRFVVSPADVLAPGEYVSGALISDEQRRRQRVYRRLIPVSSPESTPFPDQPTFFCWGPPLQLKFDTPSASRRIGSALYLTPVQFSRTPAGTKVVIPSPFLPYQMDIGQSSLAYDNGKRSWLPRRRGAKTWLRIQFPDSVLPMTVERILVALHIKGPSNRLELVGKQDGKVVILASRDRPLGTLRFTVDRAEVLRLDDRGGLPLGLFVEGASDDSGSSNAKEDTNKWHIEYLHVEARGRTGDW